MQLKLKIKLNYSDKVDQCDYVNVINIADSAVQLPRVPSNVFVFMLIWALKMGLYM